MKYESMPRAELQAWEAKFDAKLREGVEARKAEYDAKIKELEESKAALDEKYYDKVEELMVKTQDMLFSNNAEMLMGYVRELSGKLYETKEGSAGYPKSNKWLRISYDLGFVCHEVRKELKNFSTINYHLNTAKELLETNK